MDEGTWFAAHSFRRGQVVCDPWHYVPILARKPGTLRYAALFKGRKLLRVLDRMRRRWRAVTTATGSSSGCSQQLRRTGWLSSLFFVSPTE